MMSTPAAAHRLLLLPPIEAAAQQCLKLQCLSAYPSAPSSMLKLVLAAAAAVAAVATDPEAACAGFTTKVGYGMTHGGHYWAGAAASGAACCERWPRDVPPSESRSTTDAAGGEQGGRAPNRASLS